MSYCENATSSSATSPMPPSPDTLTITGMASSPLPRMTEQYTLPELGCTAKSRMVTSLREQPRYDAREASKLSRFTSFGLPRPASPTSMAKIAAPTLSAANSTPSGPKASGPYRLDRRRADDQSETFQIDSSSEIYHDGLLRFSYSDLRQCSIEATTGLPPAKTDVQEDSLVEIGRGLRSGRGAWVISPADRPGLEET